VSEHSSDNFTESSGLSAVQGGEEAEEDPTQGDEAKRGLQGSNAIAEGKSSGKPLHRNLMHLEGSRSQRAAQSSAFLLSHSRFSLAARWAAAPVIYWSQLDRLR